MPKKTGANAVQAAAMGHNSKEVAAMERECVEFVAKKTMAIRAINDEIKEKLREGKEVGVLKGAVRGAVKTLLMSDEQQQAKANIDAETQRITEACKDLPLFGGERQAA